MDDSETCGNCRFFRPFDQDRKTSICAPDGRCVIVLPPQYAVGNRDVCEACGCDLFRPIEKPKEPKP